MSFVTMADTAGFPPPDDRGPVRVRVPFLRRELGAGDVIAGVTRAAGIQPCEPCEERRRKLNQLFQLQPWGDAR
jgi:hypothetical protein